MRKNITKTILAVLLSLLMIASSGVLIFADDLPVDTNPPVIGELTIDKTRVKIGDTIHLEIDVNEIETEIETVVIEFVFYDENNNILDKKSVFPRQKSIDSGEYNNKGGLYYLDQEITDSWQNGDYAINIFARDIYENVEHISSGKMITISGSYGDSEPPEIISVSFDKKYVMAGDTIELRIIARDEMSDVKGAWVSIGNFEQKSHISDEYYIGDPVITKDDNEYTTIKYSIKIPEGTKLDEYIVYWVSTEDVLGNYVIHNDFFTGDSYDRNNKFAKSFEVVDKIPENYSPVEEIVETPQMKASQKITRRVWGDNRYGTSFASADLFKELNGKHDNVVVASGSNFPDALSGGYLTKVANAPLILVNQSSEGDVTKIIKSNMKPGGTVYILGGTLAVRGEFEKALVEQGFKVKRLAGPGRYDTNLEILKESVKDEKEVIVARGSTFPDSLSGSSVGKPMLLVDNTLRADQISWIKSSGINKFTIIGGRAAVSADIETELKKYGSVERLAGKDRWETSYLVAKKFFSKSNYITIATGKAFPDALSGAPLAMAYESPIILVSDTAWGNANSFVKEKGVKGALIVGGPGVITQATVEKVLQGNTTYPTLSSLGIDASSTLNKRIDHELDMLSGLMLENNAYSRVVDMTPIDKAYVVGNYVGANYSYGTEYTAIGMLNTGSGTCFAYSELVYYMLKKLGVSCWMTVPGRHVDHDFVFYGSEHRSVVAEIDGKYYDVDGNNAFVQMSMGLGYEPESISKSYAMYLIGQSKTYDSIH